MSRTAAVWAFIMAYCGPEEKAARPSGERSVRVPHCGQ